MAKRKTKHRRHHASLADQCRRNIRRDNGLKKGDKISKSAIKSCVARLKPFEKVVRCEQKQKRAQQILDRGQKRIQRAFNRSQKALARSARRAVKGCKVR